MLAKIAETGLIIFCFAFGIFFNFGCYILQKDKYLRRKLEEKLNKAELIQPGRIPKGGN